MNMDSYAGALNNALTEIEKAYPDVKHSFLFTENGVIVTGDAETKEETMKEIIESFETLRDKAKIIGNLQSFQVNGKNGKLILSNIKNIYLVLNTSKKADKTHIYAITHVIVPTVLKTLEPIAPPPLHFTPPKELVTDTLSGFFAGDSVQIDAETLIEWTKNTEAATTGGEQNAQENIKQVRIETYDGNSACCKVKTISDSKLKGKNMIRIPEKLCKTLKINEGDLVKVKPAL